MKEAWLVFANMLAPLIGPMVGPTPLLSALNPNSFLP